jgi:hypothetical protein
MPYVMTCEGATSVPGDPATVVDTCTAAGGVVSWVEQGSALPELDLAGGALIGGAVLALWAAAWAFRVIARQLWSS